MRIIPMLVLASACTVGGGEHIWTFDEVDEIHVFVSSGDVEIVDEPGRDTVEVMWDGGGVGDNANPDVYQEGGLAVIDANGGLLGGGDMEVWLPPGVHVAVWLERGSVEADLVSPGDQYHCVAAGDVSLEVPAGSYYLDIEGGVGSIKTDGVSHDDDAETVIGACVGAGSVEITGR